ncbi:MAG: DUF4912 domain-containing protein [Clostridia bacterium]|nr:DUF4912 domain-containing protein [Clostridia bacterium]
MPRKTKEQAKLTTKEKGEKKKTTTTKKTEATKKKTSTAKKTTTKTATTKTTKKKNTNTRKKTTTKKAPKKQIEIVEYYDLPYRYNQTIVKVLAQTPTHLFIYWDISDEDRKNFEKQYGENFFHTTKPILMVYNDTMGYQFEVEINDFANSWYLHVPDSKCNYRIELGRRPITKNEKLNVDYVYISTSNEIESPNDKILFDHNQKMVYFRDVKTGAQTEKSLPKLSFIRNMGKIYNIYDFYQTIYQNENVGKIFDASNPTS